MQSGCMLNCQFNLCCLVGRKGCWASSTGSPYSGASMRQLPNLSNSTDSPDHLPTMQLSLPTQIDVSNTISSPLLACQCKRHMTDLEPQLCWINYYSAIRLSPAAPGALTSCLDTDYQNQAITMANQKTHVQHMHHAWHAATCYHNATSGLQQLALCDNRIN